MPSPHPPPNRSLLFRLIKQFEDATYEYALRGTRDPEEYALITQDYRRARKRLYDYVREHSDGPARVPKKTARPLPPSKADNIEDQLRRSLDREEIPIEAR